MLRQSVDDKPASEAIQKLEKSFLLHQEQMKKVMAYLDGSKPAEQINPQRYHRFSGANPLLRPFDKITQTWQGFIKRGFITGFEDERYEFMKYIEGYKGPEQIYLETNISNYYKSIGIVGEVMISDVVIDIFFHDLCRLLLKKDDIILSSSPIYGHFFNLLNDQRAKLYLINTSEETGFKFTAVQLNEMLQTVPDAKAFLFIHPDNPTGVYYSKEELEELAAVFVAVNNKRKQLNQPALIVIVDEVISNLVYSNGSYTHLASISSMQEFTVTMTSLSKDQSPEYSFATLIGPKELTQQLKRQQSHIDRGKLISIAQIYLPGNQNELQSHHQKSMQVYQKNLALLKQQLEQFNLKLQPADIAVRLVIEPAAGFQVLLQINGLKEAPYPASYKPAEYVSQDGIHTSLDFAAFFRDICKVELVPGEGFNLDGNLMMFRMSISKTPRQIKNFFKYLVDAVLCLKPLLSSELSMLEITRDYPADNDLIDYRYLHYFRMSFTTATRTDYFEEVSPVEEKTPERRMSLR